VRAAAAVAWLKPAYTEAHGGLAGLGVLQQLAVLGLSQSPMNGILSFSVSDSTAVSDAVAGEVAPPSSDEVVLLGASDSNPRPVKKQAEPLDWYKPDKALNKAA
jgi:hypothetical protein